MTDTVWEARMDERYTCVVVRTGQSTGTLIIKDGDLLLHEQEVVLSWGAEFGPDVADVAYWQDICIAKIDGQAPPAP